MKHAIYTKGSHPHVIVELSCDIDRLVQNIMDEEITPDEVVSSLGKGMVLIQEALKRGIAKRDARAKE